MVQRKRRSRRKSGEPELYDFRSPMKLPREHGRVLELALGSFTRHWANQLVVRLRSMVNAHLDSVEMRSYGAYIAELPATTSIITLNLAGPGGTGMLVIPLETTLSWVDRMLGGGGAFENIPPRELTEIEQMLLKEMLQRSISELNEAFASLIDLDAHYAGIQYNPQFVQAMELSSPAIVAFIRLEIEEQQINTSLMVPASILLDALRDGERIDTRSKDQLSLAEAMRERLVGSIEETPVTVRVEFDGRTIHPREFLSLKAGDTLPLYHPTSKPLHVKIDDLTWADAVAGTAGSRLAAMVVSIKEHQDE